MTQPVTLRLLGENGQLVGVLRSTDDAMGKFRKSTEDTDRSTKKLGDSSRKTAEDLTLVDKSLTSVKASSIDLAKSLAGGLGLAGVASAITIGITKARDFRLAIAEVSTALSDTSKLSQYANQTRAMAREYGLAATDQAKSLYEIISAGQTAESAMLTLDTANRLAVGGLTSVEVAADGLTSVLNAYGDGVKSAADISDILFTGAAAGKTNIDALSSSLGQVAPIAATVGVEFQDLVASIATLTLGGVSTNIAVTQMRSALNALIKPTGEAEKLAEKLGLQFDVAALKSKGLAGFLQDVREKTGGSAEAIATLFGSTEAIAAVLSLTGTQAETFAGVLDQMTERAGKTDIAFGKIAGTADFEFKRAMTGVGDLLIRAGDVMLNVLAPAAKVFADNLDQIGGAISTGATIAAAYIAVFVALPAAYNLATVAGWNFVAMLTAQNVGLMASVKAIGLVKVAAMTLFAAFAGWQIGTYLREQFVEVRVFGIAMVNGLLNAWERLKYGVTIVWESIKLAAQVTMDAILESFAMMLRAVASTGDVEIFGKKVFGGAVGDLNALADSISGLLTPYEGFETAVATATAAMNKQIAANDEILGDMAAMELSAGRSAKTQAVVQTATKATTQALAAQGDRVELTKKELGELTKAYTASARAIEEYVQDYMAYQQARTGLEEGYANEIALMNMSNKERKVGVEMLRFMQENYDYLTGLSKEAAKAELDHAESVIRTGEAALDAADDVQSLIDQFADLNDVGLFNLIDDIQKVSKELARVSDKNLMGAAFDPEKVKELQETVDGLNTQLTSDIVGSFRAGLEAAQAFTEEGSSGFKVMEKGIAALSILQDILALKAAVAAVMTQGEGEPYSAWARMAAMAAAVAPMLASIGVTLTSFGGGGGSPSSQSAEVRQERQGTGTVLGDEEAKSESILNALEITADATSELVGINRGMLRALQVLESGIGSAAGMLARGAGAVEVGPLESQGGLLGLPTLGLANAIFGGKQELIDQGIVIMGGALNDLINSITVGAYSTVRTDGGWFSSDDVDTNVTDITSEFGDQFSLIMESIANTVREGALALGVLPDDIEAAIAAYRVEEIKISLKDLSAEEQQAELSAVFSSIFDGLAGNVVPWVEQFQQIGEGLGETLVRVATSVQVTQEAMMQLGFSLDETDPELFAQIAVGLIEMTGGIDAFIEGMSGFMQDFAPDAHNFEVAQNAITRALAEMGLELPTTRDGMWELMQSLDATTEEGREQIAMLLGIREASNAYYTELERQAAQAAERAATIASILDENSWEALIGGMSSAERAIAEIEKAYDAQRQTLIDNQATVEQLNMLESQRTAALEAQTAAMRRQAQDILNGNQFGLDSVNMTSAERAIAEINRSYAEQARTLQDLGATTAQQTALEIQRITAIEQATAAMQAQIEQTLDGLAFDLNIDDLDETELAQARVNAQYDKLREQLIDQGATVEQLTRLEELRTEALDQATAAIQNNGAAMQQFFDYITAFIGNLRTQYAQFLPRGAASQTQYNDYQSWIEGITGFQPNAQQGGIVDMSDTVDMIRQQYAAQIATLNTELAGTMEQLSDTPWYSQQTRRGLESKIAAIRELLRDLTNATGDAVDYAEELFSQQLSGLLGGLRSEFGDSDPVADINARFDALRAQAEAWGATNEELAEIETYRAEALASLIDDRYESEMQWIKDLMEFRDSLLLDEGVSTLTPQQRLDEARRQYDATLLAAQAGDADAQASFQQIAQRYLEESRSFYGSSEEYSAIFQGVLDSINAMITNGGTPVTIGTGSGTGGADGGTGGTTTETTSVLNTAPIISGLETLNATTTTQTQRLEAALAQVAALLQTVVELQGDTVSSINDLAEAGYNRV